MPLIKWKKCIVACPPQQWLCERSTVLTLYVILSFLSRSVVGLDHHPDRGGRALNRDPGEGISDFINYCFTSCKGFDFFLEVSVTLRFC